MKIISPLAVYLPRKTMKDKKYILNLNNYRNWHYIVSNKVKEAYNSYIGEQLIPFSVQLLTKPYNKVSLTFKYFKGSKRKCDRANIYCIHEKFFCDALVHCGVIEDDSDEYIKQSIYLPVEYDKDNPRVEIEINEA